MPDPPKPPPPPAPMAENVDLSETKSGVSSFEEDLKRRRKKAQTKFAGETGGYGGSTNLG